MRSLQNKTAVIVGGTSGIGAAIAEAFVRAGARVIPVSRKAAKIRRTLLRLRALGNDWNNVCPCDVTDEKAVAAVVRRIVRAVKRIDIAVCTAGTHGKKDFLAMTTREWKRILDVNLTGTYFVNKHIGAHMVKQGRGSLINVSSLGARVALSKAAAYSVSKAGVAMLTKALAVEWAPHQVRVNALLPGVFPTELNKKALRDTTRRRNIIARTPMKRFGALSEITRAAVYLASDESAFVTGTELIVDGGFLASAGF